MTDHSTSTVTLEEWMVIPAAARERPHSEENPFATFTEWAGDADERAYADL